MVGVLDLERLIEGWAQLGAIGSALRSLAMARHSGIDRTGRAQAVGVTVVGVACMGLVLGTAAGAEKKSASKIKSKE